MITQNQITAYDLIAKLPIDSLAYDIEKNTDSYNESRLSFIDETNELVLLISKVKVLLLKIDFTSREYTQTTVIDNILCQDQELDNCVSTFKILDTATNRAKFIRGMKGGYKDLSPINGYVYSIDSFIDKARASQSGYKFEHLHRDGIQEQRLSIERLQISLDQQTYKLYSDIDNQIIGFVQQQFTSNDLATLVRFNHIPDIEVINHLENSQSLHKFLMYYPEIGNIINVVAKRPRVLEYLIKELQLQTLSNLPILMLIVNGESALDVAIRSNQIKSVILLLDLIVKFQNNHSFNHLVDKNLLTLIEKQINLAEYFESNLPLIKINHKNFPDLHHDDEEIIVGVPNILHPKQVLDRYYSIFSEVEQNHDHNEDQQHPIDYYLVNLPETLTQEPQMLMQVLSKTDSIELFEYLTIQTIINFKWQISTKRFFQTQFAIFLVFCFSFLFEIMYTLSYVNKQVEPITDERNMIVLYISKAISLIVLIYFFIYEIKQALKQEGYLKEIWNFFDYTLIVSYLLEIIIEAANPYHDSLAIIKVLVVCLTFLKISFFLRIYDGFSFLVSMMAAVFVDLKYFIGFFIIFILQFGIIFAILFDATSIDEYSGIGIVGYFMMAFRTSSGDFNVDSYKDQSQALVIISWTIWVIAVFLLNIMFMNFIIAVISESYEKVMQKLIAESYRVKVQMIVERELHFTEQDLCSCYLYPKYLILRRPVSSEQNDQGEWQGFVKDIKQTIKSSASKQRLDIQQNILQIDKSMGQVNLKIDSMQKQASSKEQGIDKKFEDLNQKLSNQDEQIESIKTTLTEFISDQQEQMRSLQDLIRELKITQ
eukprot:403363541